MICTIVPLISCVIVHCHLLYPISLYIIHFHSLSGSPLKGPRIPIILPWSNFMWLYLDTFHFLRKGRRPASHNPMTQPSIDLPLKDERLNRMPRQTLEGQFYFLRMFLICLGRQLILTFYPGVLLLKVERIWFVLCRRQLKALLSFSDPLSPTGAQDNFNCKAWNQLVGRGD